MILFDKLDYIKEKNNIMDITDIKLHMDINTIFSEIKNNKSSKYNYIQNNLENRQEAKELLIEGNEEIIIREKIMHEPQTINLLKIYGHLFEPIDYFFLLEQEYQVHYYSGYQQMFLITFEIPERQKILEPLQKFLK